LPMLWARRRRGRRCRGRGEPRHHRAAGTGRCRWSDGRDGLFSDRPFRPWFDGGCPGVGVFGWLVRPSYYIGRTNQPSNHPTVHFLYPRCGANTSREPPWPARASGSWPAAGQADGRTGTPEWPPGPVGQGSLARPRRGRSLRFTHLPGLARA
jgi:hypothetical protein